MISKKPRVRTHRILFHRDTGFFREKRSVRVLFFRLAPVLVLLPFFPGNLLADETIRNLDLSRIHTFRTPVHFFPGDGDPELWSSTRFPDASWGRLPVYQAWTTHPEFRNHRGISWYRIHFFLKHLPEKPVALEVPFHFGGASIFINGHLFAETRNPDRDGNYPSLPGRPAVYEIPLNFLQTEDNVLAIRTRSVDGLGGFRDPLTIGPREFLLPRFYRELIYYFSLAAVGFFLFLFYGFHFLMNPHRTYLFYYAGFSLGLAGFLAGYAGYSHYVLDSSFSEYLTTYLGGFLMTPFQFRFLYRVLELEEGPVVHIADIFYSFTIVFLLASLFSDPLRIFFNQVYLDFFYGIHFLIIFLSYIPVIRGYRLKKDFSVLLGLSLTIFIASVIPTLLSLMEIVEIPSVMGEGYIGTTIIFSIVIALKLRKTEENLEKANLSLTEYSRQKDEFLAITSHELRTPLHALGLLSEGILLEIPEDQNQLLYRANLIHSSTARLSRLVDDLLDYTRITGDLIHLDRSRVSIPSILEAALELNRPLFLQKGLKLEWKQTEDLPAVMGDRDRIFQVIQNILENALKFSRGGSISLEASANEDGVWIQIRDEGIGIPPERIEEVFYPYRRLDQKKIAGSGLGLSIARKIVELHGGSIDAVSRPEGGTLFRIRFPLPESNGNGITSTESGNGREVHFEEIWSRMIQGVDLGDIELNPPPENSAERANRILLIEDEPLSRMGLIQILNRAGYPVDSCSTGEEALDLLNNGNLPDLVILDLLLPGINGYEICRRIRKLHPAHELPVLLISAKTGTADAIRALDAGANDFLPRPFEGKELIVRLENLLTRVLQMKRIERMGEETAEQLRMESKRIHQDFHDFLGGKLIDMRLLLDRLAKGNSADGRLVRDLRSSLEESIKLLRNRLASLEDMALVSENFTEGIQMLMLRRYSSSERILHFHATREFSSTIRQTSFSGIRSGLLPVIMEIVTNDLKYGLGESYWSFSSEGSDLILSLETGTNFDSSRHATGKGTPGISRRVSEMEGVIHYTLKENQGFSLRIRIPRPEGGVGLNQKG